MRLQRPMRTSKGAERNGKGVTKSTSINEDIDKGTHSLHIGLSYVCTTFCRRTKIMNNTVNHIGTANI